MSKPLKPCPFCNSKELEKFEYPDEILIQCKSCGGMNDEKNWNREKLQNFATIKNKKLEAALKDAMKHLPNIATPKFNRIHAEILSEIKS